MSNAAGPSGFAVAILAKAPTPGLAKTRLIPLLGADGAARAQHAFIHRTLRTVAASDASSLTIWCAPDTSHRAFRAAARFGADCLKQPDGDLGERLAHAAATHFKRMPRSPLLIVGTDCPALGPSHLRQAADALPTHDAVLVPAEDGGYVLIGLARELPVAFERIDWSTPVVAAQTRERLDEAGARTMEFPPLWDVDEPADWIRYRQWRDGAARLGTKAHE